MEPVNAMRRRPPLPLVLALVCHFAVATSGAEPPAVQASITVRLSPYVGRLVTAPVVIEKKTLTFLVDTGGGQTLITPRVAAMVGCTPRGRSVGFRMNGDRVEFKHCESTRLEIGGRAIVRPGVAVWDVMSVLPEDLPTLDGVLALDAFEGLPVTLDLAGATLTLESPASLARRLQGTKKVTARVATGLSGAERTVFLRGSLDEPGWFLFDSANLDLVQAGPHMLGAVGPLPREVEAATLKIDGLPPTTSPLRVRDLIHDGALSETFLRAWVWTFDLARSEIWAAPSKAKH